MATKTFTRSKILDEIHVLREKITEETKDMSPKEEVKYWSQNLNKGLSLEGYRMVTASDGSHIIKKK